MRSYSTKYKIKLLVFSLAVVVVGVFILFLNNTVTNIKNEERKQILLWAEAVQKRYALVEYTNDLFEKLSQDERKKVKLWSEAQNLILSETNTHFLTFLLNIVRDNKNIPIILTDSKKNVVSNINFEYNLEVGKPIPDSVFTHFSKYEPIKVTYNNETINYLHYTDSKLFAELQNVMNNMIQSFIEEIVKNSVSVPVIITTADSLKVVAYGNIKKERVKTPESLAATLSQMSEQNQAIPIMHNNEVASYIFYEDSLLITRLTYYPYILILITIVLLALAYLAFRSSKKYEQNQVWVGMSKETAHQLGTPISSLMAWVEILKDKNIDDETVAEINKDVSRLNTIAERFSKIGSKPYMNHEDLYTVVFHAIEYMKQRSSQKVRYSVSAKEKNIQIPLNISLFEWVIENICRNAIDAMQGNGRITVYISTSGNHVNIDIEDTGKGIARNMQKQVFKPGFSTKTRGWGLGLSLSKRIIEDYHQGKIFVKSSEIGKGTTFRISLPIV